MGRLMVLMVVVMMMMMMMMRSDVGFSFVALEDGAQVEQLGHDASDGPDVDRGGVVFGAQ
jgi:hypothetical protein